ncbi:hypothetical protein [Corallococcus sp. AS-1-6]|uniref:hypothetical protein n=1 Tax=Corallococcus sp. AS-1-6 TaxID=2874599 RepID=UPI001CBD57C5|nr:hypothetical protein [Corallococcus sp. AS-1-6]MBZ4371479.1 hypothetical protein [Corallococcus sp. AS-1-6]
MAQEDLLTADLLPGNVRDAADPARLPLLITAASLALAGYVGYPLHRRAGVVESVASPGGRYFWLRSGGVREVTRVQVCGVEVPTSGYALESALMGRVLSRGEAWPFTGRYSRGVSPTPQVVEDTGELLVTYDAGWVTPGQKDLDAALVVDLPGDLQLAAQMVVGALVHGDGAEEAVSESIGGTSLTRATDEDGQLPAVPARARRLVARYRRPRQGGV